MKFRNCSRRAQEQGLISVHEEQLINSIFDFRETIASEIMTPSAEMVCADISTPPSPS